MASLSWRRAAAALLLLVGTVYADACCHFNPRGLQLLEDAIAGHVLGSAELGRLALATPC